MPEFANIHQEGPSSPAKWLPPAVFLLLVMALSWLDRSLPSVFLEAIRRDIELTDSQLGLLTGTAFALCYALGVVPAGWLADRWHRPRLLALGVATWSLLTMAVAFAHSFEQLFVCRMGVGLGEAVLLPTAYSLLNDLYASDRRTRAVATMALGVPIGSGFALLGGSSLAAWLDATGIATSTGLASWRLVFVLIGGAGLLIAALALALPEPRRAGGGPQDSRRAPVEHGFKDYIWRSRRTLAPLVAGATTFNMGAAGFLAWMVALLVRNHGETTAGIGSILGLTTIATGLAAAPLAVIGAGWVKSGTNRNGSYVILTLCSLVGAVGAIATSVALHLATGFVAAAITLLVIFMATAILPVAIMDAVEAVYVARASAILIFFASVFGTAFGPFMIGTLSDVAFGGGPGLRLAVALGSGALLALAALCFARSGAARGGSPSYSVP